MDNVSLYRQWKEGSRPVKQLFRPEYALQIAVYGIKK